MQQIDSLCYKTELIPTENVTTAFFKTGETKIELLESNTDDGVIARYIAKKGEGIHHIAFEVADIDAEMKRLKELGFTLLNEKPAPGADNKLVCFLHPKDTTGVLVELCQAIR
jgi:methylmalonyl-CoA/ethylmalonyl-CoA epimerase